MSEAKEDPDGTAWLDVYTMIYKIVQEHVPEENQIPATLKALCMLIVVRDEQIDTLKTRLNERKDSDGTLWKERGVHRRAREQWRIERAVLIKKAETKITVGHPTIKLEKQP